MIELSLDTKAVEKALVKHVSDNLGITTEGKQFEFNVIVGRKTASKPKPEVTAVVRIFDADEKTPVASNKPDAVIHTEESSIPLGEEVGLPTETPEYSLEDSSGDDPIETTGGLFG